MTLFIYILFTLLVAGGAVVLVGQRKRLAKADEEARIAQELANRVKSSFLANMSHELRTPLTTIIGHAELLMEEAQAEGKKHAVEDLHHIRNSALNLLTMINDVLMYAMIESGKWRGDVTDFSLSEVVQEIVGLHSYRIRDRPIWIHPMVSSQVPRVLYGDVAAVREILTTLLENAIKFTVSGEISLQVDLDSENSEAVVIRFVLRDTGVGIEREDVVRIFKVFETGDNSTTRQFGGAGLGLAICKGLVGVMGGTIQVESSPGHGATFAFTLGFRPGRMVGV